MIDTTWTVKGGRVLGPAPFFIAGIVNVTPDSFYDGGAHGVVGKAVAHGLTLARQGAHILDVGGESTRPYAETVPAEAEIARVLPVIEGLLASDELSGGSAPAISVDTTKAVVAARALDAGAVILNDVSAFSYDPALADVIAQYRPGYVLMHSLGRPGTMQDSPRYADVVDEVMAFFGEKLERLDALGLPGDRIVLDPGIGFGKTLEHNLTILRGIERFKAFGLPVFMGLSNKSLWQGLLGLPVDRRQNATQAATAIMAAKGVPIHRVHEVESTRQTLTIVHQIA
ncbi:MAG: dihydropteroate synthase [Pseudodesulfovibrio sp.]|uniref:Dihydropteroate synthase n=1 Tax=Pseudodesulfovibrio aespoeensis (strain ATCC 700646 / DSM 10631 / Aspo-2) TaxID=643562 RepID=E6VUM9_PSEA9|nr:MULTISPECIES: dihydropteroate synthase [Pseudodesulfovibrio]MBU4193289.1 dihydropteroate synthase [Pseudomonadota bacterium]ADU62270.1 dihydropteroate synthase [Pseudodesulfovibrio aespoeensis Aspo-2]MBU4243320.1 dihydropteroate synthase [Pseudomonadota bacterium]MBU4380486.1 dihydropteroate synthase [Pseudomonadota bacterium]MBU4474065.1 dihydropteroate synthase [Pseudomonadota bacterium]